jgi:hypothetical protein
MNDDKIYLLVSTTTTLEEWSKSKLGRTLFWLYLSCNFIFFRLCDLLSAFTACAFIELVFYNFF